MPSPRRKLFSNSFPRLLVQTFFLSFLTSSFRLKPCASAAFRAHPYSISANLVSLRHSTAETVPGGTSVHGIRASKHEPFGLVTEVAVNFTIPGTRIPRWNFLDRNDLGGLFTVARTSSARDRFALASFRLGSYLLVSSTAFHAQRIPACAGTLTEVSRK